MAASMVAAASAPKKNTTGVKTEQDADWLALSKKNTSRLSIENVLKKAIGSDESDLTEVLTLMQRLQ